MLQIFGQIQNPYINSYANTLTSGKFGLVIFINNILRIFFIAGGLLLFFNLVIAGFQFINSGSDPKQIENAWNKIWQSVIGLLIMAVSFLITAIFGFLLFGDPGFIFKPKLYGP